MSFLVSPPAAVMRATHTLPLVEIQPVNVSPSCEIARGSPKYDHAPAPSSRSGTARPYAQRRGLARYCLPALSRIVLPLTLSRTDTTPVATLVSVPAQESCTSHFVPRTVAALYWPRVRNEPEPSPHSLRVFGFFFAACAPRHGASGSLSVRSVVPPDCVTLKMPS